MFAKWNRRSLYHINMPTPFISVSNVTKKFGDFVALEDISFTIEKGDIVALVGPNGSGKSTLATLLIGLENPTEGKIQINGKDPVSFMGNIGYVPQRFIVDRTIPISVEEFLLLAKGGDARLISRALSRVGLAGSEKKRLGILSGGQLQRILVARALLHKKDILIFDEPTSGIDVGGEEALYELLHRLNHEDGTTIIVISHELDFVYQYATNVICLNRRLLCTGLPKKVLTADVIEKMYGGHVRHYAHDCEHKH